MIINPVGLWRQAHQDGFRAPIGFKTEFGTTIPYQVKFNVPSSSKILPLLLAVVMGKGTVLFHKKCINGSEGRTYSLDKFKSRCFGKRVIIFQVIEKYSANAAGLIPVPDKKIIIRPFFEIGIISR